jgi:DNA uptake protein ComE-like DNA-binding protein
MGEPVDVNFASEEELREVEGIGREYAAAIIAARTQHGVLTPAVLDTV